jgi:hypothetical protein
MARDFWNDNDPNNQSQGRGLLGSGWRPLERQFDWNFLNHLLITDPFALSQKFLHLSSNLADAVGRNNYAPWANLLNLFSQKTKENLDEFWEYITPAPPFPDHRYGEVLSIETPVPSVLNRNSIPIDSVLNRLQELTLFKILDLLGCPDLIMQYYLDRYFYYPRDRFISWDCLEVIGTAYAYWPQEHIWLEIYAYERGRRCYTLIAKDIAPLANKATYNLAVMLSGYQSRVGQVHSQYPIRSFPDDIQAFTDVVQQAILNQDQLAVLIQGEPGTGKTAWAQAVAKEILVPLGYVIFILDHDAVENFVPPSYLEQICLIINEADNLAQNRATETAQRNNKTEHILSLLDGTLYQSIIEDEQIHHRQKLVVLMTCNTTERLDPALLRKGRVDLTCEFVHRFV